MKKTRAFSLLELTLVIAIAAILAALVWPQYQRMLERARSVACMSNLRQIGIAVGTYLADNDNTFPFIEPNPADRRNRCLQRQDRARPVREGWPCRSP